MLDNRPSAVPFSESFGFPRPATFNEEHSQGALTESLDEELGIALISKNEPVVSTAAASETSVVMGLNLDRNKEAVPEPRISFLNTDFGRSQAEMRSMTMRSPRDKKSMTPVLITAGSSMGISALLFIVVFVVQGPIRHTPIQIVFAFRCLVFPLVFIFGQHICVIVLRIKLHGFHATHVYASAYSMMELNQDSADSHYLLSALTESVRASIYHFLGFGFLLMCLSTYQNQSSLRSVPSLVAIFCSARMCHFVGTALNHKYPKLQMLADGGSMATNAISLAMCLYCFVEFFLFLFRS